MDSWKIGVRVTVRMRIWLDGETIRWLDITSLRDYGREIWHCDGIDRQEYGYGIGNYRGL